MTKLEGIINRAKLKVERIEQQYEDGLITTDERCNNILWVWAEAITESRT